MKYDTTYNMETFTYRDGIMFQFQRSLRLRHWPKWIDNLLWMLREPIEGHTMIQDDLPIHVDFEANCTTISQERLGEWLKVVCRREFVFHEEGSYWVPKYGEPRFSHSRIYLEFADPTDAAMFKLSFG